MSPLNYYRDTVGPLGRTVTDVALVFQAMIGADPLDPLTDLLGLNNVTIPDNYTQFLFPNSLKVLTNLTGQSSCLQGEADHDTTHRKS